MNYLWIKVYSCLCNSKLLLLDISLSIYSSIAQIREPFSACEEWRDSPGKGGNEGPCFMWFIENVC